MTLNLSEQSVFKLESSFLGPFHSKFKVIYSVSLICVAFGGKNVYSEKIFFLLIGALASPLCTVGCFDEYTRQLCTTLSVMV